MPRAVLLEREPVGGGLERIRLKVDEHVAKTHGRHGQYFEITHTFSDEEQTEPPESASAKGYFAIASAPGERTWDVIVRDSGSMGIRLRQLPLGAVVEITEAKGRGFPVDAVQGKPLMVAITGSAIAATLSLLGDRIARGDAHRTFLLYGVRDRGEVACAAELAAMRRSGIDVAICLSREHVDEPGFYKGYVQHVAQDRHWELAGGQIFLAGNDAMIAGMRTAATALGLTADDVSVNA